ncbi:MAG: hypothetical protein SVR04_09385 [Spirochaetota bacterium]|nr:hypothetical protein [Spirochaetota bacterium]
MKKMNFTASRLVVRLSQQRDPEEWAFTLCDFVAAYTRSHLVCYYRLHVKSAAAQAGMKLAAKIGLPEVPQKFSTESPVFQLAMENGKAVVQTEENGPFGELLLDDAMRSGVALYVQNSGHPGGLLIANHSAPFHYDAEFISVLEQFAELVSCYRGGTDG